MSDENILATDRPLPPAGQVDVRGPRFAAWVTTAVLVVVLIAAAFGPGVAAVLLGLQAVVFALGALLGPRRSPYGRLYALIAPRLRPVTETEPVPPLRFAQLVGLIFAVLGFVGFVAGSVVFGAIFTAFALFAAFLNAAFGICLGCMLYPLAVRVLPAASDNPA
ncbi:DUF4395 domain-containing protein [Nocardia aurantia]|uniref:DUF4395 domain-containing protein n=1 Tax=Nocardia aurantia TaxID=2585199 RepID=A0A7K0DFW0_9NOCA|nr:DUF4395 domain-containing protein [Nocardia aurantia]MQY24693.1 hypothetical protein [Nocardia aurantia]